MTANTHDDIVHNERGQLTRTQVLLLLRAVREDLIERKQGLSYVPQQEIRAALIRIFGPGNADHTMHPPKLVYESRLDKDDPQYPKSGKAPYYYVAGYEVGCTLRIRDLHGRPVAEFTEYHFEENAPLPNRGEAHAMAITSAQSYALRRAAISLGDAMGLHLYAKGSTSPIVGKTLALDDKDSPLYKEPAQKPPAAASEAPAAPVTPEPGEEATAATEAAHGALAQGFQHSEGRQA